MKILNPEEDRLLKRERRLLGEFQVLLGRFDGEGEDASILGHSIRQLDELFLLVVVGEFNSGKSAVINALLGERLLEEGVTPTTTQICLIRYGETPEKRTLADRQILYQFPIEFLNAMTIVDTPGTNAILREHERITNDFVPRSDLVLFVTSADRPFTESERRFLEEIRGWGKKVLLVINKCDILAGEKEIAQIEEFVRGHARRLLDFSPEIFSVSARDALRAKKGEKDLWGPSRFGPMEAFIHQTLDDRSRLRLKLLNPLGVAIRLVEKYSETTKSRLASLKGDLDLLEDMEDQFRIYREDAGRNYRLRLADLENVLLEMEKRGQAFFDETFRLGRVFDLMNRSRIQQEFERQIVADAPQRIERKVTEFIDWMVESNLRQWQAVTERIAARKREHEERIIGDLGPGSFRFDRERRMAEVLRQAQRVMESYDRSGEAKTVAQNAQSAVAASAAMGAGALGLGAVVTALATTAIADVTGILMAGAMAALGLFIIPARRRQGKLRLLEKIGELRRQLLQSLQGQLEKEIDQGLERIREAIAPYTRFIRAERDRVNEMESRLREIRAELMQLKEALQTI